MPGIKIDAYLKEKLFQTQLLQNKKKKKRKEKKRKENLRGQVKLKEVTCPDVLGFRDNQDQIGRIEDQGSIGSIIDPCIQLTFNYRIIYLSLFHQLRDHMRYLQQNQNEKF